MRLGLVTLMLEIRGFLSKLPVRLGLEMLMFEIRGFLSKLPLLDPNSVDAWNQRIFIEVSSETGSGDDKGL
ncbi:hypothetical protein FNV43_RR03534 [Rhamnella rubrinervis]|uniref:Uncharacterized protein n=1 Tax=Rhamnella rubrinervis TaxID=2594499 RepID=A0A8K0HIL9_9ROSA|nr:hypothetical protein FNV43_RR03534 [Rhamnella rubrinervis]